MTSQHQDVKQKKDEGSAMRTITLPAHFDGERIILDEPFELEPDSKLIVTVLPNESSDPDHDAWLELSMLGLARAYGDDEPDYTPGMIIRANAKYERR